MTIAIKRPQEQSRSAKIREKLGYPIIDTTERLKYGGITPTQKIIL